jgi:hypothetical protein
MSQTEAPPRAPGRSAEDVVITGPAPALDRWDRTFREDLMADAALETRLLYKEVGLLAIIGLLILLREMFL